MNTTVLPSHSSECEAAALGCVLLDPSCADELLAKASEDWFYDLRYRNIFKRVEHLRERGRPIDSIALLQAGPAEEVGGVAMLSSLPEQVPTTLNLTHYLSVLRAKAERRRLLRASEEIRYHASSAADDDTALESAGQVLAGLQSATASGGEVTAREALASAIDEMERALERGGGSGIPTGFHAYDRMTGGLHAGEMAVLAARPSMGKTALAMNIVEHICLGKGLPVGVLSLEMTATSLMLRMLAGKAGVDLSRIRDGSIIAADQSKIANAAVQFNRAKLVIDDTPGLSISQLRGYARRMKARHGIKLLVIDYLQLMHAKAESRTQEITQISGAVKATAKELGVPVLILSQLSREVEKQERSPRLSDLRESGAIEQDADVVMMLHRPEQGNHRLVQLIVAKQRNGPTGSVELEWDAATTRFTNPDYFPNTSHSAPDEMD